MAAGHDPIPDRPVIDPVTRREVDKRDEMTGIDYYQSYIDNIQQVTDEDIAHFVNTYLKDKPYVTGVLINPQARAAAGLTTETLLEGEVAR